jgi:hypothetical protein
MLLSFSTPVAIVSNHHEGDDDAARPGARIRSVAVQQLMYPPKAPS